MSSKVLRDSAVIAVAKFYLLRRSSKSALLIFFLIFNHKITDIDFVNVSLFLHRVDRPFRCKNSALWFWAVSDGTIQNSIQVGIVLTETLAVKDIFLFILAINFILVSWLYPFTLEYFRNAHPLSRFHNQHWLNQMFSLVWNGLGVLVVSFQYQCV